MRDRHTVPVHGVAPNHQSGQDDLDDERANHCAGTGRGDRRRGTVLDEKGRRVAVARYQPLTDGDPATVAAVAERAGVTEQEAEARMKAWPAYSTTTGAG